MSRLGGLSDWEKNHIEQTLIKRDATLKGLKDYHKRHPEIEKIVWFFDGSGDQSNETFLAEEPSSWEDYGNRKEYPEEEALSTLMWDLMDVGENVSGYDWYNNDGGFGYLVVDFKKNKYSLHFNERVQATEFHEEEGDFK